MTGSDITDWWFSQVESIFRSLQDAHGLRPVTRHRHQEGNFVVYKGPHVVVTLESAPDWNSVFGSIEVGVDDGKRVRWRSFDLAEALKLAEPDVEWRFGADSGPPDRDRMVATMQRWARGLDQHLDSIVARAAGS